MKKFYNLDLKVVRDNESEIFRFRSKKPIYSANNMPRTVDILTFMIRINISLSDLSI